MHIVNSEIVDSIVKELEIEDIRSASIRQIGAVVRAVEEGRIAYSRYESYLKIMDEDGKYR